MSEENQAEKANIRFAEGITGEHVREAIAAIEGARATMRDDASQRADYIGTVRIRLSALAERVVLADAGAFALSLTYLAALAAHTARGAVPFWELKIGWVALLASMFLGLQSLGAAAGLDLGDELVLWSRQSIYLAFASAFTKLEHLFRGAVVTPEQNRSADEIAAQLKEIVSGFTKLAQEGAPDPSKSSDKILERITTFKRLSIGTVAAFFAGILLLFTFCWSTAPLLFRR